MKAPHSRPSLYALPSLVEFGYRRRKFFSWFMCGMLGVAAFLALGVLFMVFSYVLRKGLPGINLDLFTQLPAPAGEAGGGIGNALLGTFVLSLLASLIGVPWGIFTGVFLSEYGQGKLASVVRFSIDMLSSIPSIVVGVFVYTVVVRPMGHFSAAAGALALAILMIPVVARNTEELLRMVPQHIREAGLALGLPRWKVILRIVVRGMVSGLTTGVILALARAAGETAPLLFTALNNEYWPSGVAEPMASLPVRIYLYATSPYESWHAMAWSGALLLVLFVFGINLLTRATLRGKNG